MSFQLPEYNEPNFKEERFLNSAVAKFSFAPKDGVAPEGYHATSIFPEYVQIKKGVWKILENSRMDGVVILYKDNLYVKEFRHLKKGDKVLVGRRENAEEGILVHTDGFLSAKETSDKFQFKTRNTRETPFSRDYDFLYELLKFERNNGFITWVLGPAVSFDKDSQEAMASLIEHNFCQAIVAGNALATHDIEASWCGTALGQDIYHKHNHFLGHYNHLDVINKIRNIGSLKKSVKILKIKKGIISSAIAKKIPLVLAGSIRDDGPLPEVIGDSYQSQDQMRTLAKKTTTVIALATQLHSIAFGNMLPSYKVTKHCVRPVYFYIVDISEFAADKLANRGSLQSISISTNVQDFCVNLKRALVS